MSRGPAVAFGLLALACGGPELLGATLVPAGREPGRASRTALVASACADARGERAESSAEVWLAESAESRETLIVARRGFDSLAVSEPFERGGETVFQFVTDDGDGPPLLHEVRFPRGTRQRATLAVSDTHRECYQGDRARREPGRVVLLCRLDSRKTLE